MLWQGFISLARIYNGQNLIPLNYLKHLGRGQSKHSSQTAPSNTANSNTATKIETQPSPVLATPSESSTVITQVTVSVEEAITNYVGDSLAPLAGYPAKFCSGMVNLRTLLGLSNSQINQVIAKISKECEIDPEYDVGKAEVVADLSSLD